MVQVVCGRALGLFGQIVRLGVVHAVHAARRVAIVTGKPSCTFTSGCASPVGLGARGGDMMDEPAGAAFAERGEVDGVVDEDVEGLSTSRRTSADSRLRKAFSMTPLAEQDAL
ncbi:MULTISPECIES: hypothetical protein [unclassified Streptomyces]|uniref:hypothetical protein n=2 Tax=unclassified Streptomyces TaxID=2593676 RepID=UPI0036773361